MTITRHFHYVGERAVHYRRAGRGPALVLLHASPVSSKVFEPMMRFYAQRYTTFAFDTPGNGLSGPLPNDDPDIADYANAQADVLEALGVEKCLIYGRHTGASIAVEMANGHPDRIAMAMTDGYPVFTEEQRKAYLSGYLEDLPVTPDGSHLTWMWARYRDQFLFWPWNKREAGNRADCDMPDIDFIQNGVVALMEAGNNYKAPYRAVFKHEALETLASVDRPVCLASRPGDSLFPKLALFPDKYWVEEMPRAFAEATTREAELMSPYAPDIDAPPPPTTVPLDAIEALQRSFVTIGGDQLHILHGGNAGTRPVIIVGSAPGALIWKYDLIEKLTERRNIIAIDPAGCGESNAPADGDVSLERQADRICAALDTLSIDDCDLIGWEAGGAIAIEVARRVKTGVLVLCDPLLVDEERRAAFANSFAEDAAPRMDGSHLLSLWTELRDGAMYFPWFDRRRAAKRSEDTVNLDFETMTDRVLSLAKHGRHHQALWRAAWDYPWSERLNGMNPEMHIVTTSGAAIPLEPTQIDDIKLFRAGCTTTDETADAIDAALHVSGGE